MAIRTLSRCRTSIIIHEYVNLTNSQDFRTELERLYQRNDCGVYDIQASDLNEMNKALQRATAMKRLVMKSITRRTEPDTTEDTTTGSIGRSGAWEIQILKHLIRCCAAKGPAQVNEGTAEETAEEFGHDAGDPTRQSGSGKTPYLQSK